MTKLMEKCFVCAKKLQEDSKNLQAILENNTQALCSMICHIGKEKFELLVDNQDIISHITKAMAG